VKTFYAKNTQGEVVMVGTDAGNLLESMAVHEEILGEQLHIDFSETAQTEQADNTQ
jgi:hypothetical protein